jgi:hypothetical protein
MGNGREKATQRQGWINIMRQIIKLLNLLNL